jgi:hypothetical protein
MSDQLCVKLIYLWLCSMEDIPSFVNKFLNFPFDNGILTMNHYGFNHVSSHGKFSLHLFWPEPMELIKPHEDFLFLSYQNFKLKFI